MSFILLDIALLLSDWLEESSWSLLEFKSSLDWLESSLFYFFFRKQLTIKLKIAIPLFESKFLFIDSLFEELPEEFTLYDNSELLFEDLLFNSSLLLAI